MRTMYATAICTGLRVGELLALRWRDVDLASGRRTVRESKTDAGAGRDVDLWPEIREELVTRQGRRGVGQAKRLRVRHLDRASRHSL
jgi:integrase